MVYRQGGQDILAASLLSPHVHIFMFYKKNRHCLAFSIYNWETMRACSLTLFRFSGEECVW